MGFFGMSGKTWKKIGKFALQKVAPIAANFIPGVGPLASMGIRAAVGAAGGAVGGGGWKGALFGGGMGAIPTGGGAGSAAGGAVKTGLGGAAKQIGKQVAQQTAGSLASKYLPGPAGQVAGAAIGGYGGGANIGANLKNAGRAALTQGVATGTGTALQKAGVPGGVAGMAGNYLAQQGPNRLFNNGRPTSISKEAGDRWDAANPQFQPGGGGKSQFNFKDFMGQGGFTGTGGAQGGGGQGGDGGWGGASVPQSGGGGGLGGFLKNWGPAIQQGVNIATGTRGGGVQMPGGNNSGIMYSNTPSAGGGQGGYGWPGQQQPVMGPTTGSTTRTGAQQTTARPGAQTTGGGPAQQAGAQQGGGGNPNDQGGGGFINTWGGPIASGVGLGVGALVGQQATRSALKRSPEEQLALKGGQDVGKGALEAAGGALGQSRQFIQQPANYYQTLLSGNRAAMSNAVAAPMAQIGEHFRGSTRSLERSGVRGAARDLQTGDLNRQRAGAISGLTTGVQPYAAEQLGKLGTDMMGHAAGLYGVAGQTYGGLLDAGQRNRVYSREEGGKAGAAIGGLAHDIGGAVQRQWGKKPPIQAPPYVPTQSGIPQGQMPGQQMPLPTAPQMPPPRAPQAPTSGYPGNIRRPDFTTGPTGDYDPTQWGNRGGFRF